MSRAVWIVRLAAVVLLLVFALLMLHLHSKLSSLPPSPAATGTAP
jgi:hypothetical protein